MPGVSRRGAPLALGAGAAPAPLAAAALLAALSVGWPGPAWAQSPADAQSGCATRAKAIAHLAAKYREAPVAAGVTNAGGLLEVLATGDGSTWTIIVTGPDGVSCVVAAGERWRAMEQIPLEPDS